MTLADAVRPEVPRVHVTAHLVPETDPPYDDGQPSERLVPEADLTPYAGVPSFLRLVPPVAGEPDEGSFDPVPTDRAELEDPLPRAAMLARALIEAAAGVRPIDQLARWVTSDVLAILYTMVANRSAQPCALRRVLVSEPLPGVAEVTAIVLRGARTEAMALRMEGYDGRWLVTAWEQP
jgi:hypothetical protein